MSDIGYALDFDGEIEVGDNEFEPVPEGEYDFVVESVERGQYNGSAKMAACPIAKVTLRLVGGACDGRKLFENFFLNSKAAWKIGQFYVCIGLRAADAPKEQKLKMEWSRCPGCTGRCHVTTREYNGKTYNDVSEWLKPEAPAASAYVPPANAVPAPPSVQRMVTSAFTPGSF